MKKIIVSILFVIARNALASPNVITVDQNGNVTAQGSVQASSGGVIVGTSSLTGYQIENLDFSSLFGPGSIMLGVGAPSSSESSAANQIGVYTQGDSTSNVSDSGQNSGIFAFGCDPTISASCAEGQGGLGGFASADDGGGDFIQTNMTLARPHEIAITEFLLLPSVSGGGKVSVGLVMSSAVVPGGGLPDIPDPFPGLQTRLPFTIVVDSAIYNSSTTITGDANGMPIFDVATTNEFEAPRLAVDENGNTTTAGNTVVGSNVTNGAGGLDIIGALSGAALRASACPSQTNDWTNVAGCLAYNTDDFDLYTSTGFGVGQWRNSRTGAGP